MILENDLARLEHAALIRRAPYAPELEYLFKHVLIQETVYDSLLNRDRRRLHASVAGALEQSYPEARDTLAGLLARHWDDAGDVERAFNYYVRAGELATRMNATSEALMAYARAADLASRHEMTSESVKSLYTGQGRAYELRGAYEAALDVYAAEEELARARAEPGLELDSLIHRATVYSTPNPWHDPSKAIEVSTRAVELARAIGDRRAEAKILWNLSLVHFFASMNDQAIAEGEASLAIARELNLREQMAYTLNDLARPYSMAKRNEDAQSAQVEARALWRELGNLPMLADNLVGDGRLGFLSGEYITSRERVLEGLRITTDIGNLWGQAYARATLGLLHMQQGELADALTNLLEAVALSKAAGFLNPIYTGNTFCGLIYSELGASDQGIALLEELVREEPISKGWLLSPYCVLAMLYCEVEDLPRAAAALEQAEALYQEDMDVFAHFFVELARARCFLANNQPDRALVRTYQAIEMFHTSNAQPFFTITLFYQGASLQRLGRDDRAIESLERAREIATRIGNRTHLWNVLALLAQLYRERGETARADEAVQAARAVVQFIADHAPLELRSLFLNRPQVRMLLE